MNGQPSSQTQQAVQRVFGPAAVHMHRPGFRGPVCGQVNATGAGWARTGYTTDPQKVTCKKCLKALHKAAGTPA
jgi:hypothetical protein